MTNDEISISSFVIPSHPLPHLSNPPPHPLHSRLPRELHMPHAVIFDMDGVLIDSYEAHFQSWVDLAAGMTAIGLVSTGRTPEQLKESHLVVRTLDELTPARIAAVIEGRAASNPASHTGGR